MDFKKNSKMLTDYAAWGSPNSTREFMQSANFEFYTIEEYCSIYVLYCGYVCLCFIVECCKRLGLLNFGSLNLEPLPKFICTVQYVGLLNTQSYIVQSCTQWLHILYCVL